MTMPFVSTSTQRLSPANVQMFQTDRTWTLKTFQELGKFTDIDIYCSKGRKVSVHSTFLFRQSPFLEQLVSGQACCSCFGQVCRKRPENVGISLPDADVESVRRMLELVYTGRTHFRNLEDKAKVESVLRALMIRIPMGSLALEHEVISDANRNAAVTIELDSDQRSSSRDSVTRQTRLAVASTTTPTRTPATATATTAVPVVTASPIIPRSSPRVVSVASPVVASEPSIPSLDEVPVGDDGKRECPKCLRRYMNKYKGFEKHFPSCSATAEASGSSSSILPDAAAIHAAVQAGGNGTEEVPTTSKAATMTSTEERMDTSMEEEGRTSQDFDEIMEGFADTMEGGEKEDGGVVPPGVARHLPQSVIINGRKKCPKCSKFYDLRKGWYKRHRHYNCKLDEGEIDEDMADDVDPAAAGASPAHKILVSPAVINTPGPSTADPPAAAATVDKKRECPGCLKFIPLAGFKKHAAFCPPPISSTVQTHPDPVEEQQPRPVGVEQQQQQQPPSGDEERLGRKKQCSKCHQFISVNGGSFLQHAKNCKALDVADDSSATPRRKEACPKCGTVITVNGGWFLKHVKTCPGTGGGDPVAPTVSAPVATSTPSSTAAAEYQQRSGNETHQECPKCQKLVSLTSGWFKRHLKSCYGEDWSEAMTENGESIADMTTTTSTTTAATAKKPSSTQSSGNRNTCRFCGKEYDGQHVWHFQQHQLKCAHNPSVMQADEESAAAYAIISPPASASKTPRSRRPSMSAEPIICFICGSTAFSQKAKLKMHVINHYRQEIRRDYLTDSESGRIYTICPVEGCEYFSKKSEHMLVHVSLTHNKLKEYLPEEQAEYFFPLAYNNDYSLSDLISNYGGDDEEDEDDDIEDIPGHKRKVGARPGRPRKRPRTTSFASTGGQSDSQAFQCSTCSLQFNSKPLYKQHLCSHYKQEIRKKYLPSGMVDDKRCPMCDYNSPKTDLVLHHIALTHKKLKDFLSPDLGETLFPSAQQSPPAASTSSATGEKKTHRCPICKVTIVAFYHYKMHLCKHYVAEITDAMGGPPASKKCQTCGIEAASTSHLVFHMGTKHDLLLSVVSSDMRKMLVDTERGCGGGGGATPTKMMAAARSSSSSTAHVDDEDDDVEPPQLQIKSTASLANGYQNGDDEDDDYGEMQETSFCCSKCFQNCTTQQELTRHEAGCKKHSHLPTGTKECHICEDQFNTYTQYKSHILVHFEGRLMRDFGPMYDSADDGKCGQCGLKCKTLLLFVRHFSIDHDKIVDYLPEDVKEAMKEEFGIDPVAITKGKERFTKIRSVPDDSEHADQQDTDDASTIILEEDQESSDVGFASRGKRKRKRKRVAGEDIKMDEDEEEEEEDEDLERVERSEVEESQDNSKDLNNGSTTSNGGSTLPEESSSEENIPISDLP